MAVTNYSTDESSFKLIRRTTSKVDKVVKYTFCSLVGSFDISYINNGTHKDILCIPTQLWCNQGCTFCHTTGIKRPSSNIPAKDLYVGILYIMKDLLLREKKFLVSFTGCGEPLKNIDEVLTLMTLIMKGPEFMGRDPYFSIATSLPKGYSDAFRKLALFVKKHEYNVSLKISYHFDDDFDRATYMPNSVSKSLVSHYIRLWEDITTLDPELWVMLVEGIKPIRYFKSRCRIKYLMYNENQKESSLIPAFPETIERLKKEHPEAEFYQAPGWDIGASCGQFI